MKLKLMTVALLASASPYGNPILWQVSILYPGPDARWQKLAPNPDHYFFFQIYPTLTDWLHLGYITGFGENACVDPCPASVTLLHPVPSPVVPEPGTSMLALAVVWIVAMAVRLGWLGKKGDGE